MNEGLTGLEWHEGELLMPDFVIFSIQFFLLLLEAVQNCGL